MSGLPAQTGFSIVEVVVAAAIIATVGLAITGAWQGYIKITQLGASYTQAALLTEEAGEAIELYRDMSWSGMIAPLALNTPYYLYWNGTRYATSTTAVAVNTNYAVSFSLYPVMRDANSNVVAAGGTNDPDTLKAAIIVTPFSNASSVYSESDILIHNIYGN